MPSGIPKKQQHAGSTRASHVHSRCNLHSGNNGNNNNKGNNNKGNINGNSKTLCVWVSGCKLDSPVPFLRCKLTADVTMFLLLQIHYLVL